MDDLSLIRQGIVGEGRAVRTPRCNSAIGLLRDDPVIIRAAAQYIERSAQGVTYVF